MFVRIRYAIIAIKGAVEAKRLYKTKSVAVRQLGCFEDDPGFMTWIDLGRIMRSNKAEMAKLAPVQS